MSSPRRPSLVLVLALVAALAFGAAASLLIGTASSSGNSPPPSTELILPPWVYEIGILVAVGAVASLLLYQRLTGVSMTLPSRSVFTILMIILLAVGFVALARAFAGGGPENTGKVVVPVQNSTGVVQNNSTGNASAMGGSGGLLLFWSPSFPSWLFFVVLAAILLVVVGVALPQFHRLLAERRELRARPPSDARQSVAAEVKGALSRAAEDLDRGGDPRAVIEALYARLLTRLTRMVGDIEIATPEEIRAQHLVRLGIRPEAAMVLTRLFEEARYSSHPLTGEAADAARGAVRDALSDLARIPEEA